VPTVRASAGMLTVRRYELRRASDARCRAGYSTVLFLKKYECCHSAGNRNRQHGGQNWAAPIIPAAWQFSRSIYISQLSTSIGFIKSPSVSDGVIQAFSNLLSMKIVERHCK